MKLRRSQFMTESFQVLNRDIRMLLSVRFYPLILYAWPFLDIKGSNIVHYTYVTRNSIYMPRNAEIWHCTAYIFFSWLDMNTYTNVSTRKQCVRWGKQFDEARGGGGLLDETAKTEVPCHSRCGTIKIPPCSKSISMVANVCPFMQDKLCQHATYM